MLTDLEAVENKLYQPEALDAFLQVHTLSPRNTQSTTSSNYSTKPTKNKQDNASNTAFPKSTAAIAIRTFSTPASPHNQNTNKSSSNMFHQNTVKSILNYYNKNQKKYYTSSNTTQK